MVEILQKKVGSSIAVSKVGEKLTFERCWTATEEWRSGDLPTEVSQKEVVHRVVYDLSARREICGRLEQVGLRSTDIFLAQAGLM